MERTADILGADFLQEETRRHRRSLDVAAIVSLLVVFLDLVPTRISTLGVDLTKTDQQGVLAVLLVFDLAFLARFLIHASSDFVRWRTVYAETSHDLQQLETQRIERQEWLEERLQWYAGGNEEQRAQLVDEIKGNERKLASLTVRTRTLRTLRRLGWPRFASDFVAPIILGMAAAVALVVELL